MEPIKWILLAVFASIQVTANVYTLAEGFKAGKINVYLHTCGRFFGEKPIRDHSLAFEPGYFWFEVLCNLFWPAITPLAIYLLFY
ncbi:MAG: hypothetical protein EOM80_14645 [Erysipelotrichia bacterium]|nr:hypothetical protein [Erysipelotrichia bacterium]